MKIFLCRINKTGIIVEIKSFNTTPWKGRNIEVVIILEINASEVNWASDGVL